MFYTFIQNNSGGGFSFDEFKGITHYVIIEADNLPHAITDAKDIGLYFNGVDSGYDCSCCGDRWYEPYCDEGTETPTIYGGTIEELFDSKWYHRWMQPGKEVCVHYKDGRKEWF